MQVMKQCATAAVIIFIFPPLSRFSVNKTDSDISPFFCFVNLLTCNAVNRLCEGFAISVKIDEHFVTEQGSQPADEGCTTVLSENRQPFQPKMQASSLIVTATRRIMSY